MKFKSESDRLDFYNSIDLDESIIVFKKTNNEAIVEEHEGCACAVDKTSEECSCGTQQNEEATVVVEESTVLVESLSDCPEFKMTIVESETNTFFVKDYESIPNSCGTGKVELSDRTSYMNMCEMDNTAVVDLTVVVEGNRISNIPFVLKKTEDEPHLVISKVHLV